MTTIVHTPGLWNRITLASFALSFLSVAAVVTIAVRRQTRSLRALAEASEKLGRGETAAPASDRRPLRSRLRGDRPSTRCRSGSDDFLREKHASGSSPQSATTCARP